MASNAHSKRDPGSCRNGPTCVVGACPTEILIRVFLFACWWRILPFMKSVALNVNFRITPTGEPQGWNQRE